MGQSRQARKLIERLRQLHRTGLCYVESQKQFVQVPSEWWLWHAAYAHITPRYLDDRMTRIARPVAPYTLVFTENGPALHDARTAQPGPSIPSNYWLTLQRLLGWNPEQRYCTLDDIRRAISEEAWPEQRRVVEVRRGFS